MCVISIFTLSLFYLLGDGEIKTQIQIDSCKTNYTDQSAAYLTTLPSQSKSLGIIKENISGSQVSQDFQEPNKGEILSRNQVINDEGHKKTPKAVNKNKHTYHATYV